MLSSSKPWSVAGNHAAEGCLHGLRLQGEKGTVDTAQGVGRAVGRAGLAECYGEEIRAGHGLTVQSALSLGNSTAEIATAGWSRLGERGESGEEEDQAENGETSKLGHVHVASFRGEPVEVA
jgi:hypothetical protein